MNKMHLRTKECLGSMLERGWKEEEKKTNFARIPNR